MIMDGSHIAKMSVTTGPQGSEHRICILNKYLLLAWLSFMNNYYKFINMCIYNIQFTIN